MSIPADMGASRSPYIVTGVANIRNPAYNIPTAGDVDVSAAVNAVLASGVKRLEWDYDVRTVSSTLLLPNANTTLIGSGKFNPAISWNGGDTPVIAVPNYATSNAEGVSNLTLRELMIADNATTRPNTWSIDLTNGNSNTLESVFVNNSGGLGSTSTDKFGVAMGTRRGGTRYAGLTFVAHCRNTRLAGCTLDMNTTDWVISASELWGNSRSKAMIVGGGGTMTATMLVPGLDFGLYLLDDRGQDIELLMIEGGYFDGSYTGVNTGIGIGGPMGSGQPALINSRINTEFWRLNKEGIKLQAMRNCSLSANFIDCDAADVGLGDWYLQTGHGNIIRTNHTRSAVAPKTGNARANIVGPFTFSADIGFPKNSVLATVATDGQYANGLYVNKDAIQTDPGASWKAQLARNNLPNATQFIESVIRLNNDFYGSNGAGWYQFVRGKIDTQAATDFNGLNSAARLWISTFSGWNNGPSDFSSQSGIMILEVIEVSSGYLAQELRQYGGTYRKTRNCQAGAWSAWA